MKNFWNSYLKQKEKFLNLKFRFAKKEITKFIIQKTKTFFFHTEQRLLGLFKKRTGRSLKLLRKKGKNKNCCRIRYITNVKKEEKKTRSIRRRHPFHLLQKCVVGTVSVKKRK